MDRGNYMIIRAICKVFCITNNQQISECVSRSLHGRKTVNYSAGLMILLTWCVKIWRDVDIEWSVLWAWPLVADAVICKHICLWSLWPGLNHSFIWCGGNQWHSDSFLTTLLTCFYLSVPIIHYPHGSAAFWPATISFIQSQCLPNQRFNRNLAQIMHNQNMFLLDAAFLYIRLDSWVEKVMLHLNLLASLTHCGLERCF